MMGKVGGCSTCFWPSGLSETDRLPPSHKPSQRLLEGTAHKKRSLEHASVTTVGDSPPPPFSVSRLHVPSFPIWNQLPTKICRGRNCRKCRVQCKSCHMTLAMVPGPGGTLKGPAYRHYNPEGNQNPVGGRTHDPEIVVQGRLDNSSSPPDNVSLAVSTDCQQQHTIHAAGSQGSPANILSQSITHTTCDLSGRGDRG